MFSLIAVLIGLWVFVFVMYGTIMVDEDTTNQHVVMAVFWPITLAVFLIIGPFVALTFAVKNCIGLFR